MAQSGATIKFPKPHPGQAEVAATAERFNVLECGRRFGKTTLGERLACATALSGFPAAWFAPSYPAVSDQWKSVINRLQPVITQCNKVERQIRLSTGGRIDFWSLDNPDSGRGRKYKRIVIDEAGIIRDLKYCWEQTIRPTLTDYQGDAWFLSTPKGRNYFHQLFAKGQAGDPGWKSWRLGTCDNPYMLAEEIADAKRDLPPHVFDQEYLGIPADDGGNPFGLKAIQECVTMNPGGDTVVLGIDLAKSQDWTVVVGLDESGAVTRLDRWQTNWEATTNRIADIVGDTPALIDSTGVGDPVVEGLQRRCGNVEGFKFSQSSKQQIMEGLAVAIQRQEVRFPAGWLVHELESFEYEYTRTGVRYEAPQGLHDDGVCALALAVHHKARHGAFAWAMSSGDEEERDDGWR